MANKGWDLFDLNHLVYIRVYILQYVGESPMVTNVDDRF